MSIQMLPSDGVSFSILDDDDLSVFKHLLDGLFGRFLAVFIDAVVRLFDEVGPDDFRLGAIVIDLTDAETIHASIGVIPCRIEEGCACVFVGKQHRVSFAVAAIKPIVQNRRQMTRDLVNVNPMITGSIILDNQKNGVFSIVFYDRSIQGTARII